MLAWVIQTCQAQCSDTKICIFDLLKCVMFVTSLPHAFNNLDCVHTARSRLPVHFACQARSHAQRSAELPGLTGWVPPAETILSAPGACLLSVP